MGRFLGRIHSSVRGGRSVTARCSTGALSPRCRALPDRQRLAASSRARRVRHPDRGPPAADRGSGLQSWADLRHLRLHGDCHPGNVLWDDGPHFVDLDDCVSGPAVQDIWMLLSGNADESAAQLADYVDGYTEFADFDWRGVRLIESLRSLRQINYAAWLARRWSDPAFPRVPVVCRAALLGTPCARLARTACGAHGALVRCMAGYHPNPRRRAHANYDPSRPRNPIGEQNEPAQQASGTGIRA